jgi:hypothetical protein
MFLAVGIGGSDVSRRQHLRDSGISGAEGSNGGRNFNSSITINHKLRLAFRNIGRRAAIVDELARTPR